MFKKSEKDIRNERIQKAIPEEKYRKPSPIGDTKWDEENFMDFTVIQRGQSIKLHTYRCHTNEVKSVTVFFHGLNEHLGQYSHIA
jgi:acylglycerol lipase